MVYASNLTLYAATEGCQKFLKIITFFKIPVTSLMFNQFAQSLAHLVTRNVYYIVYKFHLNWLRIEKVTVVRKKSNQL